MKRLVIALIAVLVLYAIYYDLTKGTVALPEKTTEEEAIPASTSPKINIPYQEKKVKPGDTVLTIVEKTSDGPLPVSISKVISDFKKLNDGIPPEEIQIGKAYKFPTYQESD